MEPIGQLGWIQIDCRDPVVLARFWGSVLGLQVDDDYLGDPPHYVGLMAKNPDHPQGELPAGLGADGRADPTRTGGDVLRR